MTRRLQQAAVVFVVVFAAAQLVRPERANPRAIDGIGRNRRPCPR